MIKTTKKVFDNEDTDFNGITTKDKKMTERFIRKNTGNTKSFQENDIAYRNSVQIEGSATAREAMLKEVRRDNGRGGENPDNNREYGGTVENGRVWLAEPGSVFDPAKGEQVSITLPGGINTFHSHPSGVIKGGYKQSPSKDDQKTSGTYLHYVFSRRDNEVYIHNSEGVIAIISDKYFVRPKRK